MFKLATVVMALATASAVTAHGVVSSPPRRLPGANFQAICGLQVYNNVNSDQYGNQQGEEQNFNSQTTAECAPYLCKALQLSDNPGLVQHYSAGQVVPFTIDIRAPHTGVANVSVVNLQTNSIIGEPLWSITDAYSTAHTIPANQTSFSVTVPNLDGACSAAGDCALQWWWDARSIDQTYMSCVDFTQ